MPCSHEAREVEDGNISSGLGIRRLATNVNIIRMIKQADRVEIRQGNAQRRRKE